MNKIGNSCRAGSGNIEVNQQVGTYFFTPRLTYSLWNSYYGSFLKRGYLKFMLLKEQHGCSGFRYNMKITQL